MYELIKIIFQVLHPETLKNNLNSFIHYELPFDYNVPLNFFLYYILIDKL